MGPVAIINLSALRHNLAVIRKLAPSSKVMAVIKADAYGHGFLEVAGALEGVDMLAVARVSEGQALRAAGFDQPVLVLEGFSETEEISQAIEHDLEVVIHQQYQVDLLKRHGPVESLIMWLKVDTGMHRLGIAPERVSEVYHQLMSLSCCQTAPGLMTHFANADDIEHSSTARQMQLFNDITAHLQARQSMANSAAILAWPESHRDWVRPGIMLYGASPLIGLTGEKHDLQPVMTLKSRLMAINTLKKGDCIGYGSSWCCPEKMPVGVIAIGYGDGYPRHAVSGTPVLVNGQSTQLVGRVSMDMITVDLRGIDTAVGDEVVLWGEGLPAEQVAESASTISYELFCGVTSRVRYEYVDGSNG